tara:strand:+ start:490 stop:957 length:468 start_codon:yes stop_codon:yes gene_type:complete
MKIIFLDIDGVLNNRAYLEYVIEIGKHKKGGLVPFDPDSIKVLNEIISETGAEVVLSSSWRFMGLKIVQEKLESAGFTHKLKDVTPLINDAPRGWEIEKWMGDFKYSRGGSISSYLILDDDSDMMYDQRDNFINTDFDTGFRRIHKPKALKILKK